MSFRFAPHLFAALVLASTSLLAAGPALAEERASIADVKQTLAAAEASLASLESQVSAVERAKAFTEGDKLEATLARYRGELQTAFTETLGAAEREAKRGEAGAKLAAARLAAWEELIPRHRERMEQVVGRLNLLDATIKTAEAGTGLGERLASLFEADPACVPCQRARLLPEEPAGLGGFLAALVEPEADAAIAVTCVAACTANPGVCGACIIAAVGTGAFVATKLDEAFAACERRPTKIGRAVCKAATVVAFITVIA